MHLVSRERVGELERFAQAHQPLALGVVEVGETIANGARVAAVERDNLFGGELRVSAERFKDANDDRCQ